MYETTIGEDTKRLLRRMELNDKQYTLHIDPIMPKRKGRFKEGNIPWNRGMSWEEQGVSEDVRKYKLERLREGNRKRVRSHEPTHSKPVIQYDEYGNRLHWYVSSEAAARKVGCCGRNIRSVCQGKRYYAGGYHWEWDKCFIK